MLSKNTITFSALFLTCVVGLPLRREADIHAQKAKLVAETIGTAVVEASVATESADADFTPLFEPMLLGDNCGAVYPCGVSSPPISVPIETVTRIVTAIITPPPITLVSWVTAAPSSSPVPSTTTLLSSIRNPVATYTLHTTSTGPPASSTEPAPRSWSLAAQFTDLNDFNVQKYAGGEKNIQIVTGIPAAASTDKPNGSQNAGTPDPGMPYWNNATDSAMQLLFPKGSVNPGNKPQGGSDFYATPIPLDVAINVTMEYSVFMDSNMNFVKGGKLPGLYGGHEGCSGGNVANTCFSTRLMWRSEGVGELYLYADKTKQLPSLCQAPNASCNEIYGLSLGRGSFKFGRGAWTDLRQTVRLNTPGIPDGGFTLDVNGKRVMSLEGIYYRDSKPSPGSSPSFTLNQGSKTAASIAASTTSQRPPSTAMPSIPPEMSDVPPATPSTDLPPLLGGILGGLGGLLGGSLSRRDGVPDNKVLFRRQEHKRTVKEISLLHRRRQRQQKGNAKKQTGPVELIAPRSFQVTTAGITQRRRAPRSELRDVAVPPHRPNNVQNMARSHNAVLTPQSHAITASGPFASSGPAVLSARQQPAFGFTGIFFSTFFGGHDPSWATPKDQYIWFKGFALTVNR